MLAAVGVVGLVVRCPQGLWPGPVEACRVGWSQKARGGSQKARVGSSKPRGRVKARRFDGRRRTCVFCHDKGMVDSVEHLFSFDVVA